MVFLHATTSARSTAPCSITASPMPSPAPAKSSKSPPTKEKKRDVKIQRHPGLERPGVSQQSQLGGTSGTARESRRSNRNLGRRAREDGRGKETSKDRSRPVPNGNRLHSSVVLLCAELCDAHS